MIGAFSVSLAVKDIGKSKAFYEAIGFEVFGGKIEENWLIMKNGDAFIGLFQDMFDKNVLTFNPGWGHDGKPVDTFKDVREIQRELKEKGIKLIEEADEQTTGPAYFTTEDPDGNPILFDQHV